MNCVVITVYNDHRVAKTVASVLKCNPDRVLLCDGGSTDGTWKLCEELATHANVEAHQLVGSVAETRAQTMPLLDDEITLFLDSDETVEPNWLAKLTAPILAGEADVTGGPTQPLRAAHSSAERYVNRFDAWFYDTIVANDAASLPMGNSAWRTSLLHDIGGFDARFTTGGEDFDVNLRARAAGARFQYVPEAFTWHDQSHLNSYGKLYRRMVRYAEGATLAYLKNDAMRDRRKNAVRASSFTHPGQILMLLAKARGYLRGKRRFRSW